MKRIIILSIVSVAFFSSCQLFDVEEEGLTTEEIVEGLKTALEIGADSASGGLSVVNGYYQGDPLNVKIPLPDEANAVRDMINDNGTLAAISETVGLEQAFEDVILSVNRAAEDAASEAAPIFKEAITDLTISQGWDILNGQVPEATSISGFKSEGFDSTAATQYLKLKTYDPLTGVYAPKINTSLGKDIVGNVSAVDAWSNMTGLYNNFVGRGDVQTAITIANIAGANINLPGAINDDLGEFATQKALDGLFYMVGQEEKKIRKNPFDWAVNIIQKVFGSVM